MEPNDHHRIRHVANSRNSIRKDRASGPVVRMDHVPVSAICQNEDCLRRSCGGAHHVKSVKLTELLAVFRGMAWSATRQGATVVKGGTKLPSSMMV